LARDRKNDGTISRSVSLQTGTVSKTTALAKTDRCVLFVARGLVKVLQPLGRSRRLRFEKKRATQPSTSFIAFKRFVRPERYCSKIAIGLARRPAEGATPRDWGQELSSGRRLRIVVLEVWDELGMR
jgi:hypothetical protein